MHKELSPEEKETEVILWAIRKLILLAVILFLWGVA